MKKALIFLYVIMILLANPVFAEDLVGAEDVYQAGKCGFSEAGIPLACAAAEELWNQTYSNESYSMVCQNGECVAIPDAKE